MGSVFKLFWVEPTPDGLAYRRPDTGEVMPYPSAFGYGAVYVASAAWAEQEMANGGKKYPDGLCVVIYTPGGEWCVDGCSYNESGRHPCPWTRSGDPRDPQTLDVNPSINFPGRYHGFCRNGQLVEC